MNSQGAVGSSREVFAGKVFKVVEESYRAPDGEVAEFEFAETRDVVRVYPLTSDRELLIIDETRYGVSSNSIGDVLRTVSGGMEDGESPEQAAVRELREETGYVGARAVVFHVSQPMLKVRCSVHHVLVLDAKPHGLPAGDSFEEAAVRFVAVEEVPQLVWSGMFVEDTVAFGLLKLCRMLEHGGSNRKPWCRASYVDGADEA